MLFYVVQMQLTIRCNSGAAIQRVKARSASLSDHEDVKSVSVVLVVAAVVTPY